MKSIDYEIVWNWRDRREAGERTYVDKVRATNATRAIARLEAELRKEYSFERSFLVILAVAPIDYADIR